MKNFPAFLILKQKSCLVVGGGTVATRRVNKLLKAQARITVVSPCINNELKKLKKSGKIIHIAKKYNKKYLKGMRLVIAASDNEKVNQTVAKKAKQKNILVNVVDKPLSGDFIMPSTIERDPITVAISTGGVSPTLTRMLRAHLEIILPSRFGKLAKVIKLFKNKIKQKLPSIKKRRRFWENVLEDPIAETLYNGQEKRALALLEKKLHTNDKIKFQANGAVYLVGGGPGDPDLLTFRALRLMQKADVVLYDRLISPKILSLVRKDAKRIYVGKVKDNHILPQNKINQLLLVLAKQNKRVLRLKGGDPFIFGRGGEEIELLSKHNIPFQIVPGITAASGCAAYAGIPLTHRDYAKSCLFITGHLKEGKINLNWPAIIQPEQTLAVYMGAHGIEILSNELINHGIKKDTPAAIVEQGTTVKQKTYITTVYDLPNIAKIKNIKPPSMIIIGDVVRLHKKLAWFEPKK